MAQFPASPEALTTRWLSDALGIALSGHRVERFGAGAGIIGMVTRVHLDGVDPPRSVIVKFPSASAENRAVAAAFDMYGREVHFYQDLAGRLSLRTPQCHAAAFDPTTQDFVLVLEDLAPMAIGDQIAGCDLHQAHRVVEAIAQLHAAAWQPKEPDWLVSHNNPMQVRGMAAGFEAGWPVVLAQFGDLVSETARRRAKQMPQHINRLLAELCRAPVALSHADVRLDNIFFDDANEGIVLVDWQSVCTSAPEHDLAYFVTQSLDPAVAASDDLVAYYHAQLTRRGIDYDLARCRERFRTAALYLLCYAVVIAGTLDLGNERGKRLGRALLGRSLGALDGMAAFDLLD